MEFTDDAFVLSVRPYGETGALAEFLTETHGRLAAHVAGGASRRLRPLLQPGARLQLRYRARTADNLGSAVLEAGEGEGASPAALFDDPLALAGLNAAAAVAAGALTEREAAPGVFHAFAALRATLDDPDVWPAVYIRFELGLLEALGFGLDLTRCAVTGGVDDLAFVSPRTGRAVCRAEGLPYASRLLALPPFLLGAQAGVRPGEIAAGLALTGAFLERWVFHPLNRPLPPPRQALAERLGAR